MEISIDFFIYQLVMRNVRIAKNRIPNQRFLLDSTHLPTKVRFLDI